MMKLRAIVIDELFFDRSSIAHMWERHQVTEEEVVGSILDPYSLTIEAKNKRIMTLGRFQNRAISAIVTPIDPATNKYYCITARDMSKSERKFYRDINNLDRSYKPKGNKNDET